MLDPLESTFNNDIAAEDAFDFSNGVLDALRWNNFKNSRMRYTSLPDEIQLISESLEHITLNPKNVFKTFMLRRSYVYAADEKEGLDSVVVNLSRSQSEKFVASLLEAADIEWEAALKRLSALPRKRRRIALLTGEKGSGKTFFLNHLYSEFHGKIDAYNTVWVRVNLSRERGFDKDLGAWYRAQITKILLRYYESTSEYRSDPAQQSVEIVSSLIEWANSLKDPVAIALAHEKIGTLVEMFCKRGSDDAVNPATISADISLKILNIGLKAGLRFLVVLDGFDRLDCDRMSRTRFRKISSALMQLMGGTTRSGVAFLIVCRDETLAQMANCYALSPERGIPIFKIGASSFYDIVISRVDSLIHWFNSVVNTVPEDRRLSTLQSRTICEDFREYFTSRYEAGEYDDFNNIFLTNNRACVQMLAAEFLNFASERKDYLAYRIIEMATLAGFEYPPVLYRYAIAGSDRIQGDFDPNEGAINFDTRFFPLITRPPIPRLRDKLLIKGTYFESSILHGIRILQLLNHLEKEQRSSSWGSQIGQFNSVLLEIFGYNEAISAVYFFELEAYGCVRITRHYPELDEHPHDGIRITPKGRYLLKSVLSDPAYLNLCAMRTVVGRHSQERGLFRLSTLADIEVRDNRERLFQWAISKITNALSLARIIKIANHAQEVAFNFADSAESATSDLDIRKSDIENMFHDTRQILSNAARHLAEMYSFVFAEWEDKRGKFAHLEEAELKDMIESYIFS